MSKADIASLVTVGASGLVGLAHVLNDLSGTYMPLISAIGILGGLGVTGWYYAQLLKIKRKE